MVETTDEARPRQSDAAAASDEDALREELPAQGTPEGDKLYEAHRAFEKGNFLRVRALCDELRTAAEPEVVEAAGVLRRRVQVDPLQIAIIAVCAVVFLSIVYLYVVQ